MKMKAILLMFVSSIFIFQSCEKKNQEEVKYWLDLNLIEKPYELENLIVEISELENSDLKEERLDELWDSLKLNNMIPYTDSDSVYFLYKGSASSVAWAGDFSGWSPNNQSFQGKLIENTDVWIVKQTFPGDARLDYKIVRNNSSWILDPANPFRQASGFGYNSELRMPDWKVDPYTVFDESADAGVLSDWKSINSTNLGYEVDYKVYTPYNYDAFNDLPVVYITDGHEYSNPSMGNVTVVLDNLISQGLIEPLIAVFIDPRNPSNKNENRRMNEYGGNDNFTAFVADELVTVIDQDYKTNSSPEKRLIMGTSMGGLNSAYFGAKRSDVFQCIAIHSPAFAQNESIYDLYSNNDRLPLKIFMSTGVIYDTQNYARQMKTIFESKSYPLEYIEVNEGHSWGNWRQLIDEPLIYFFGI